MPFKDLWIRDLEKGVTGGGVARALIGHERVLRFKGGGISFGLTGIDWILKS